MINFFKRRSLAINTASLELLSKIAYLIEDVSNVLNYNENSMPIGIDPFTGLEIKFNKNNIKNILILYNKDIDITAFVNHLIDYINNDIEIIIIDTNGELTSQRYEQSNFIDSINYIINSLYKNKPNLTIKLITELIKISCNLTNHEMDLLYNIIKDILQRREINSFSMNNLIDHIKNLVLRTPFENEIRYSLITKLNNIDQILQKISIGKVTNKVQRIVLPLYEYPFSISRIFLLNLLLQYLMGSFSDKRKLLIFNIKKDFLKYISETSMLLTDLFNYVLTNKLIYNIYVIDDIIENNILKLFDLIVINKKDVNDHLIRNIKGVLPENVLKDLEIFKQGLEENDLLAIHRLKFVYCVRSYKRINIKFNDDFLLFV